jgi:hypothetical protein
MNGIISFLFLFAWELIDRDFERWPFEAIDRKIGSNYKTIYMCPVWIFHVQAHIWGKTNKTKVFIYCFIFQISFDWDFYFFFLFFSCIEHVKLNQNRQNNKQKRSFYLIDFCLISTFFLFEQFFCSRQNEIRINDWNFYFLYV